MRFPTNSEAFELVLSSRALYCSSRHRAISLSNALGYAAAACDHQAGFNAVRGAAAFSNRSARASSPADRTPRGLSESRSHGSSCFVMTTDMLRRLEADPGSRTIGELLQERAWALNEILRLRSALKNLRPTKSRVMRAWQFLGDRTVPAAASDSHQLLRIGEVCAMVGLSRAMVYRMISEKRFPAQTKVSPGCARWRMSDVISWQSSLRPSDQ